MRYLPRARRARTLAIVALIVVLGAAGLGLVVAGRQGSSEGTAPKIARSTLTNATRACGSARPRPYRHVVWIWMENQSYDTVIGSPDAPFTNRLAARCGLAVNYHNITHPSLPNYIAATAGSTLGVTDDCDPAECSRNAPNLFSELQDAGLNWEEYAESMPSGCGLQDASGTDPNGDYTAHHDPAAYYVNLRSECHRRITPLGTPSSGPLAHALKSGLLPALAFITPNDCDNMHDCPIRTGDAWLSRWVSTIITSPPYRSGHTVLFITWDEGDKSGSNECAENISTPGCHVATVVVSPSTPPGTRSAILFNHYSLLRTAEQILKLPLLGHAGDSSVNSMVGAFHLS
jgi:phosphatidylinositol-3-phosphatase